MSWGYFADLRLTLPARKWTALKKKTPSDYPLDADWSGMREAGLRTYFAPVSGKGAKQSFAEVLEWPVFREECLREETRDGANVVIRVALDLDRSQLELAGYLGALLAGVQALGGDGKLALVNDGSYGGEDGHELVVRDGKRSKRALRDRHATRKKLTREIYPDIEQEDEDDDEGEEVERTHVSVPEPEESDVADPQAAMTESVALYNQGSPHGARDRLDGYFSAGGVPTRDVLSNYTVFLRIIPPKRREDLDRAHGQVLGALDQHRELRADATLLENAVAFLNENGRAAESIDVVLRAVDEGLKWTPNLALNTTCSANVAKDDARARAIFKALEAKSFDSLPMYYENWAGLLLQLDDRDAAMRALEKGVSLAPDRRAEIAKDDTLEPLRTHPRWDALMKKKKR